MATKKSGSYENSKADMKADKAGAKKAKMTMAKYEGSAKDMKMDRLAMMKIKPKKKK